MNVEHRWRAVCYRARVQHQRQIAMCGSGEGGVLVGQGREVEVILFLGEDCETLTIARESWTGLLEQYLQEARRRGGVGVGVIVSGVLPEEEAGKLYLRPALLTQVMGVGACDGRRFEIGHRYESDGDEMVLYGPISRNGTKAESWKAELGMEGVLVGPWPFRFIQRVSSGGEVRTE